MNTAKYFKYAAAIVIIAITVSACDKEFTPTIQTSSSFRNKVQLKFYNGIIGSNRTFIYADRMPLVGSPVAYGSAFPSVSPSHFALEPGLRNILIRDTLFPTTQAPVNADVQMQENGYYTAFAYDSLNNAKLRVVNDLIGLPINDTAARLRFANFPYSTAAIPNVDIFSVKRNANVFTNISTTSVTDFIPFASALSDTLFVRPTGTTDNLTALNNLVLLPKRSYTVIFRGSYRATSGTNARTLTSFLSY